MKVAYCSLGCKVNDYETLAIVDEFLINGFELVDFNSKANVYIINTCTVTAIADSKSKKMIRRAIRLNPSACIAIMGCYAKLHQEEILKMEGVSVIIGTSDRTSLFSRVMTFLERGTKSCSFYDLDTYEELKLTSLINHTRAFIKIQDGCDNYCSYCAIPFARGKSRSREVMSIIDEINLFGKTEVVLSGINIGKYGLDKNFNLVSLLKIIFDKCKDFIRLRISSIEMLDVTDELLELLYENKKRFAMHFHLPLQSGSNKTLLLMNRNYTQVDYENIVNKITLLFPYVNITSDILVGFPLEDEIDFRNAFDFTKNMNFGETHVFVFSKRPNTLAYNFEQLNPLVKKKRSNEYIKLNDINALKYRESLKNNKVINSVLVEKVFLDHVLGYSEYYVLIRINNPNLKVGTLVKVHIIETAYPISVGVEVNDV